MLGQQPGLKAVTLFEYIQQKYPDRYPDAVRRTLERRVKQWRAVSGSEKEVIFRQVHQARIDGHIRLHRTQGELPHHHPWRSTGLAACRKRTGPTACQPPTRT